MLTRAPQIRIEFKKIGKHVTPRVTFEAEIPRGASPGAEHSFVHLREPDDFKLLGRH